MLILFELLFLTTFMFITCPPSPTKLIQRVMCKHCGRTHALFVECMVPSSMLLVTTQIDLATVPYSVIEQMLKHPLTAEGIEKFQKDYRAVFGG